MSQDFEQFEERLDAEGGDLQHQRQPDRRQVKLPGGDGQEIGKQPQPACFGRTGIDDMMESSQGRARLIDN